VHSSALPPLPQAPPGPYAQAYPTPETILSPYNPYYPVHSTSPAPPPMPYVDSTQNQVCSSHTLSNNNHTTTFHRHRTTSSPHLGTSHASPCRPSRLDFTGPSTNCSWNASAAAASALVTYRQRNSSCQKKAKANLRHPYPRTSDFHQEIGPCVLKAISVLSFGLPKSSAVAMNPWKKGYRSSSQNSRGNPHRVVLSYRGSGNPLLHR
jgi:hypothetical protein